MQRKRPPKSPTKDTNDMVRKLDKLAEFEAFVEDVPAELRQALLEGKDASALYKKYANYAAVRVISIIAKEKDSGKALAAAKELLDRTYGKATERKEIRHQLEDLKDEEIDAIILSELDDSDV